MALPPGPSGLAVVNAARFARRPLETLLNWQARYGNVFSTRFPVFGTGVYVAEPDEIRAMFTGDQSEMLAGEANSLLAPVLGDSSVLVLDGARHMRQRKLLLPPFQGSAVTTFRTIIRDVAKKEIAGWTLGDQFALRERMRSLTFNVICRAVFGVTEPARVERLRRALLALLDLGSSVFLPGVLQRDLGPWSPGGRLKRRLGVADGLLYEEIELRRREPDLDERTDVLSLLLLARLRDELDAGSDAYLDAVVTETLRLRPVIDAAERTLTKPRMVAGYELPAGIRVYPGIALVHMREDIYPQAEQFRPERFLDGKAESYSWLPFGGGIRRCIGAALAQAEMAEVIRIIVERLELSALAPETEPVVLRGITLAPRHGTRVRVERRRVGRLQSAAEPALSS